MNYEVIIDITNQLNFWIDFLRLVCTVSCDLLLCLLISSFLSFLYYDWRDKAFGRNVLLRGLCLHFHFFQFFQMSCQRLSGVVHSPSHPALCIQSLCRHEWCQAWCSWVEPIIGCVVHITCKETCINAISPWPWTSAILLVPRCL